MHSDPLGLERLKLLERVKSLEEKVFKSKRDITSRAQQMLLIKHSGLLEQLPEFPTKKAKAKFLSVLLNGDADNIEEDLSDLNKKISGMSTKKNYEYIIRTFDEAGLHKAKAEAEKILDEILKIKG